MAGVVEEPTWKGRTLGNGGAAPDGCFGAAIAGGLGTELRDDSGSEV
jgi:hypothetical protein